jgi:hypothetical protein
MFESVIKKELAAAFTDEMLDAAGQAIILKIKEGRVIENAVEGVVAAAKAARAELVK